MVTENAAGTVLYSRRADYLPRPHPRTQR
jgi:hypothetical protein